MITSHGLTTHVTVATNGGPGSRAALRWASDLLLSHSAAATLVTVEPVGTAGAAFNLETAENILRTFAEDSRVDGETRTGDPVDELIESATAAGSELIVIGGQPGIGLRIHGSVHGRLAAVSPIPVAVIPAGWRPARGPITVGVAADLASDDALDFAVKLGRRMRLPIRMTSVHDTSTAADLPAVDETTTDELLWLEARARELRRADAELEITVDVRAGETVPALTDAGEESSILVLGRRHHSAIGRVLGSTSALVLAELPCPVIVVPRQEGLQVSPDIAHEDL
jgi:nucleotide-binding universal stress UspA family protein